MLRQLFDGQETKISFQLFPGAKVEVSLVMEGINLVLNGFAFAKVLGVTRGKRAEEKHSARLQPLFNCISEGLPLFHF